MTKPLLFSLLLAILVVVQTACAPSTEAPADAAPEAMLAQTAEPTTEEAEGSDEEPQTDAMSLEVALQRYRAVYEVEAREGPNRSPCSANVTVRAGNETLQFMAVAANGAPWRYGTDPEPGALVYASAQTNCDGEVIVRLYLDGELFRQASNGGRFAVATVRRVY